MNRRAKKPAEKQAAKQMIAVGVITREQTIAMMAGAASLSAIQTGLAYDPVTMAPCVERKLVDAVKWATALYDIAHGRAPDLGFVNDRVAEFQAEEAARIAENKRLREEREENGRHGDRAS